MPKKYIFLNGDLHEIRKVDNIYEEFIDTPMEELKTVEIYGLKEKVNA